MSKLIKVIVDVIGVVIFIPLIAIYVLAVEYVILPIKQKLNQNKDE